MSDSRREVAGVLLLLLLLLLFGLLNPEDGTDRLSLNVGKKLPGIYACCRCTGKRKALPLQARRVPGR